MGNPGRGVSLDDAERKQVDVLEQIVADGKELDAMTFIGELLYEGLL